MRFKIFGRDPLREKLICSFAAALFAVTIFIYFCAQNTLEIPLKNAVILSGVIFTLAALIYAILLMIFRRAFLAFIICIILWLTLYSDSVLTDYVSIWWPWEHGRHTFVRIVALVITAFICTQARKINKPVKFVSLFTGVIGVIFLINAGSLALVFINETSTRNIKLPVKFDFSVDENTKSPNIYWIHPDGMLGVDAVKKYFGESQEDFLTKLKDRGFEINPSANFEARHETRYAIPILMNPYSYDNWARDEIFSSKKEVNNYIFNSLERNSELQYAFAAKKYALNIISGLGVYCYYPSSTAKLWLLWLVSNEKFRIRKRIFSHEDIMNTTWLTFDFPNSFIRSIVKHISSITKEEARLHGQNYQAQIDKKKLEEIFIKGYDDSDSLLDFASALYDILYGNYKKPSLTIIHVLTPHYPFIHDADGNIIRQDDNKNPLNYYLQHVWSAKILINVIDMILEKDSDAIIIIQSDHGLHGNTEEDFKSAFGEKADKLELWNSTMSAIRVPPEFQTGEEHYALESPLNITRYLINNFVGRNYEYLNEN